MYIFMYDRVFICFSLCFCVIAFIIQITFPLKIGNTVGFIRALGL